MAEVLKPTRMFRFDEMAIQVRDKIDPAKANVDRYVGLEHIDPESLKIRRWGETTDVESSKIVFKSGNIIFGKRRAYQRKLAVADFDGICSAHAMVLRPRTDVVLKEFLPFFMQSDIFMDRAVMISVGGLSPTINWKDLAKEEFALPPLEEQRRIAEVLQAAEIYRVTLVNLENEARRAGDSLADDYMRGINLGLLEWHEQVGHFHGEWPLTPLGDLLQYSQYGLSNAPLETGRYPILRMTNLANGKATEDDMKYVDLSDADFCRYRLRQGEVLFNRTNSHELVGRTAVYDLGDDHVFASYLVRLKTRPTRLLSSYLCAYLSAPIGRRQVMSFATRGVSQTNVNATNLKRILIPLPLIDYQQRVVDLLATLDAARQAVEARCAATSAITKGIINGELGW